MKKRLVKKIAMLMAIVLILSTCVVQASAGEYEGAGDLIRNHTFDNGIGLPWRVVETYPATANFDITADGKFKITVSKIGSAATGQRWDVQLSHRGLTLLQGHTYTVQFTVTADRDCLIYPRIGDQGDPYYEYWHIGQWEFLQLKANQPTTVTQTFKQEKGDKSNVEFAFHLAPDRSMAPSEYTGTFRPITFTFDDMYLKDPQFIGYPKTAPEPTNVVRLNQEGFYPNSDKIATVATSSTIPINWQLVNSTGTVVFAGKSTIKGYDHASGNNVHIIDFSNYRTVGTGYKIVTDVPEANTSDHPTDNESMPFNIGNDIYSKMKYDSIKYFYHHRSGITIEMPYCDQSQWARPAGHTTDILAPDPTKDYSANYTLDVTGGWYDAGDYGKYVVNGGISTWTLMNSYERALYLGDTSVTPFIDGSLNIPESGNGFPDILDEARYNLKTLLNMQVPAGNTLAGMVHHKAGDERWLELATRPDQDTMKRYLQPPTTVATLNLAAIAAQGSRLWKQYDAAFATKCLTAAEAAWDAAVAHPNIYPPLSSALGGTYAETYFRDDFYWAACELYVTTGSQKYLDYIKSSPHYLQEPTELAGGEDIGPTGCFDLDNTAGMGTITLALVPNGLPAADIAKAKDNIMAAADKFISIEQVQGYGVPIEEKKLSDTLTGFPWGSNSFVVNNAIVMSYAYLFSGYNFNGRNKYLNGAITAMDYILGRNPNVQSYVTGYGDNPLENPHHRFWAYQADNSFPQPPAGCMSGGPNSGLQDPWVKSLGWKPGQMAAEKCFVDNIESWSTNELAINWNAPLAWMSAFLDEEGRTELPPIINLGDVNGDGEKDAIDFALIKKALLNGDTSIQNADVNNDGSVDAMDLALYKSFLLGKANF
ncbi:glycoside hydrolase family 9 protein [Clostridium sp. BNL1100]|uniref:glycoside hydrolase family 9 protein n=1 Tax=Clostridium sp. BNL1100 TaxID=755731 RepID=UPI00024A78E5|nr:glycoside hydrolase family 9 protein [Clostridium sp. BNL1100]AEY64857.1 putative carbohydrate binding protein,dockerin-like protein [Clostridium sp. BNL1100]